MNAQAALYYSAYSEKKIMAKGLNQSLFKLIEKRGVTNTMIRVKGLKQENSQVCADYCRN